MLCSKCGGFVGDIPKLCVTDADCPDQGKSCESGFCVAKQCDSSDQCGAEGVCYIGFCQPATSVPNGDECERDTDCAADHICSNGYCINKAQAGHIKIPGLKKQPPTPISTLTPPGGYAKPPLADVPTSTFSYIAKGLLVAGAALAVYAVTWSKE